MILPSSCNEQTQKQTLKVLAQRAFRVCYVLLFD
jgi:hypothetical protein